MNANACVVCHGPCTADDVSFAGCRHRAHASCIKAWANLDWGQGKTPCPVCHKQRLNSLPSTQTICYLDDACSHCADLDAAIGQGDAHSVSFERKHVNSTHPRIQSKFPHTFTRDPDTLVEVYAPNDIVIMFANIGQIDIEIK